LPVLLLPSDYFANRVPDPVLQQIEHPLERDVSANDAFRAVSRFFDRVSRPEQLLASLPEAFRILTDPAETGAVTISLPEDVQAEAFDWPAEFFQKRVSTNAFLGYSEFAVWQTLGTSCGLGTRRAAL
jgi:3D-(3,5/4)-trihydroxycyclohexane-1,2-dione acylhydrolase (decyclizing)